MDNTGLVSLILPIYNVENYIQRSIDAAINQTYKNLQIILVDDGSTDNSYSICESYKNVDSRIEVIHKKNGGLSDARNAGLKAVKGDYIFFYDPDDYIELNLIEICVKVCEEKKCDIVVFNYYKEDEAGNLLFATKFKPLEYYTEKANEKLDYIEEIAVNYCKTGWNACNRFFRANIIKNNGIIFANNKVIFAEDLSFALRVALYQKKLVVIKDILYHYPLRKTSIMNSIKELPFKRIINLCYDFKAYAEKRGFKLGKKENFIFTQIIMNEFLKAASFEDAAYIFNEQVTEKDVVCSVKGWLKKSLCSPFKVYNLRGLKYYLKVWIFYRKICDKKVFVLQKILSVITSLKG